MYWANKNDTITNQVGSPYGSSIQSLPPSSPIAIVPSVVLRTFPLPHVFYTWGNSPPPPPLAVSPSPLFVSPPQLISLPPSLPYLSDNGDRKDEEEGRRETGRERWNIIAAITLGESISEKGMEEANMGESRARFCERAHCFAKQKQRNSLSTHA